MTVKAVTRTLLDASTTTLEDGSAILGPPLGTVVKTTWAALGNSDTGAPLALADFSDRSVQIEGTFGTGGTIVIEGSNDGTNYYTLHDAFGNSLSFIAAGLKSITEITTWIRPKVTAGDGTTALVPTMIARR